MLFIYNPRAGRGRIRNELADILDIFASGGYEITISPTRKNGDAEKVAAIREADFDIVVCCGGDGTLNGVIDGLLSAGLKTPIGYIPAGSTNDFASSVGLPKGISECVSVILNGTAKHIDIGSFNGRYFSYVASFGAFTSVTYTVPQNLKNIFGHAAYVMGGINELAKLKPIHARITLEPGTPEEQVHEGDYVLGTVSNSKSIGGILNLEKLDVDMNDGLMEVMMIKMPRDLIELSDIAASTLGGTFKSEQIETYSAHSVDIELDEGTHWTLDGEYEEGGKVCEIRMIKSAISLIL